MSSSFSGRFGSYTFLISTFDIFETHLFDSRFTKRVLLGHLVVLYACYPCCQIIGTHSHTNCLSNETGGIRITHGRSIRHSLSDELIRMLGVLLLLLLLLRGHVWILHISHVLLRGVVHLLMMLRMLGMRCATIALRWEYRRCLLELLHLLLGGRGDGWIPSRRTLPAAIIWHVCGRVPVMGLLELGVFSHGVYVLRTRCRGY